MQNDLLEPSILTNVEGLLGTVPAVGQGKLYGQFGRGWDEMSAEEGNIWPALDVSASVYVDYLCSFFRALSYTLVVILPAKAYSALVADSVLTFAFAARTMYRDLGAEAFSMVDTPSCHDTYNSTTAWSRGQTMLQYITGVSQLNVV